MIYELLAPVLECNMLQAYVGSGNDCPTMQLTRDREPDRTLK